MSDIDLDWLATYAAINPDDNVEHEGDCCGSLCDDCGHCLHSIEECDHDCDGQGGGCSEAADSDEIRFRRAVLRLVQKARDCE